MAHEEHFNKDIAYHAQIASEYDQIITEPREFPNDLLFAPLDPYIVKGERMLDLGCGTGQLILRYGERFDSITGVDHSPDMLARASLNLDGHGLKDVRLQEANLFDFLEFDQGSYDFVSCVGCLHHLPLESIPRVFELVHERLNPKAVFLLSEPIDVNMDALPADIANWNASSIMKERAYTAEPEEPDEAPISQSFLRSRLAENGLRVVAESRGWELFPQHWPPSDSDKQKIRELHEQYGETGNILCLAVTL